MDIEKKILLEQLEQYAGSKFEKSFSGAKGFVYYFSKLDVEGIKNVLSDDHRYDGYPKDDYLELIGKAFDSLKYKGITSLEAHSGVCSGCIKGCYGFTFIDAKKGYYVDIIIEHDKKEITYAKECYGLRNNSNQLNKKQRLTMDPLLSCCLD